MTRFARPKFLVACLAVCMAIMGYSQSIEHQGVVSAGGAITSERYALTLSIGGLILENIANNNHTLKHGYLGPSLTVNVLAAPKLPTFQIDIYPNPFAQRFRVRGTGDARVRLKITNSMGQEIHRASNLELSDGYEMDLSQWAEGIYLLHVARDSDVRPHIFKLVKTN